MTVKDLVIIHGLNNSQKSFAPLKRSLTKLGFKVHLFSLAGHQEYNQKLDLNNSLTFLEQQFDNLQAEEYYCLGFSQGGLVLELLPDRIKQKIKRQVLLAPALAVKQKYFLNTITKFLPARIPLISLVPKQISKFSWLSVAYFDLLFSQINQFQKLKPSPVPTLVLVDPRDELIDVPALTSIVQKNPKWQLELFPRPNLPLITLGQGHILFFPKYFTKEAWVKITNRIAQYLQTGI